MPKKPTAKATPRAGRPKGSNKEDTLARLLPIARRLFAEKGFAQTTFKDVGKALGMTHAAIYSYFPSKTELYIATLLDTQQLLLPNYLQAIANHSTLKERLAEILRASAKAHDKDSTITGFLAAVPIEMSRHQELRDALSSQNDVMTALESIFQEAIDNNEIKPTTSAQHLAIALFGGGVGVALFQYGMPGSKLSESMEVFIALLNANLFTAS